MESDCILYVDKILRWKELTGKDVIFESDMRLSNKQKLGGLCFCENR